MSYKLKINSITKEADKYGNKLIINRIGLYDESGKWIKWVKLNDELIETLKQSEIIIKL
jgi:hypothetical protein